MQVDSLISAMTPEVYQRLRQAVETGKWADGTALTQTQRETSLQAVMMWQARNNPDPQHMTIGQDGLLVMKSKVELKREFMPEQVIPSCTLPDQ